MCKYVWVWRLTQALLVATLFAGCLPHLNRTLTPMSEPASPSMCKMGSSQSGLLITEWSGAEKANLETILTKGAVPVAFSGCSLRILPQCRLGGTYNWHRTTVTTDGIDIRNEADLYTKFPLGAISLSAELKRSGTLHVRTTVAGQHRLEDFSADKVPQSADCQEATHIISAMSVGAFTLNAGAAQSVSGGAEVKIVGGGGGNSKETQVLKSAGDANRCSETTDEAPHIDCGSPVQVFLEPIFGKAEVEGPPGSVRADFVSSDGTSRWDVYIDDEATCTTPCTKWVEPQQPVRMHTRAGMHDKLQVQELDNTRGPLKVTAQKTSMGKLTTGLTFTALGGMTLITGITLTAIGCSSDNRESLCKGGLIAGGIGLVVVGGSIWLMLDALPKVTVSPVFKTPQTIVRIHPTGISGRF